VQKFAIEMHFYLLFIYVFRFNVASKFQAFAVISFSLIFPLKTFESDLNLEKI